MTTFLLYLMLWVWDNRSFDTISRANYAKSEAEKAYIEKDYPLAVKLYKEITYGSIFIEPAARLYLAHSYYNLDSLDSAFYHYGLLNSVNDQNIASKANTQLAVILASRKDTMMALQHLQTALRQNPQNNKARYDYELLKKQYSGKLLPPKPQAVTKKENAPPAPTNQPDQQTPELAEQRDEFLDRLKRLNMSEEQARSILDAMKSNEAQYIYQLRRRQYYKQSQSNATIEW